LHEIVEVRVQQLLVDDVVDAVVEEIVQIETEAGHVFDEEAVDKWRTDEQVLTHEGSQAHERSYPVRQDETGRARHRIRHDRQAHGIRDVIVEKRFRVRRHVFQAIGLVADAAAHAVHAYAQVVYDEANVTGYVRHAVERVGHAAHQQVEGAREQVDGEGPLVGVRVNVDVGREADELAQYQEKRYEMCPEVDGLVVVEMENGFQARRKCTIRTSVAAVYELFVEFDADLLASQHQRRIAILYGRMWFCHLVSILVLLLLMRSLGFVI
jgi:hypothetical protein